jgi:hypothetical protein
MSAPSCKGGAAHFGGKPLGVGEYGPVKLEPFTYCNKLRRVSLSEIKSEDYSIGYPHAASFSQIPVGPKEAHIVMKGALVSFYRQNVIGFFFFKMACVTAYCVPIASIVTMVPIDPPAR